jgi:glycosyltransferase involved in cell wall biosynthesis
MRMSIAIPTWECHGRGGEFLDDLLRTIEIQSFKDFEVCISDHSENDDVLNVCSQFEDKFKIHYSRNLEDRGNGPANTNAAMDLCTGDIIKIMFQDDFFYDDEALEKIEKEFVESVDWLVCGSNHTQDDGHNFYWELYPKWNDDIIGGVNTISSPSVVAVRREVFNQVKFDEKLVMMMDCEYYYHARKLFGDPVYYNDVLVTNRVHSNQISSRYLNSSDPKEKLSKEVNYCKQKHLETLNV